MYSEVLVRNKFSDSGIEFLINKYLDCIINDCDELTKREIIEKVRNLRDELDRWG